MGKDKVHHERSLEEKRALLKRLLMEKKAKPALVPLSFSQQSLWLQSHLQGPDSTYNMRYGLLLKGSLNLNYLERSFDLILKRHGSLRTTFVSEADSPMQRIAPSLDFKTHLIDMSGPTVDRDELIQNLLAREASRPFDLEKGPLLRVGIYRFSPTRHVMLLVMHHIISDGWSMSVFVDETIAAYKAFDSNQNPALPPLPMQYSDYARAQRKAFEEGKTDKDIAFWKENMAGAPALLELPTTWPRPAVQRNRGAAHTFLLEPEMVRQLKEQARKSGATLFMALGAGLSALLSRYSRQTDLVLGTPVANRRSEDQRPLIGFFVNMLALRMDLTGNPAFPEMIRRTRSVVRNAFAHQALPFDQLLRELNIPRRNDHQPLVQVLFVLHSFEVQSLDLPGLEIEQLSLDAETTKFDLHIQFFEKESGLEMGIIYNRDLFSHSAIDGMGDHFQNMLQSFLADPEAGIHDAEMLAETEKKRLLTELESRRSESFTPVPIHRLFEARATRVPDHPAVVVDGQTITYNQLLQQARKLAARLAEAGAGPETRVAVLLPRGPQLIPTLFAALMTGSAYVGLDETYPLERLSYMLEDSKAALLVSSRDVLERYGLETNVPTLFPDDLDESEQSFTGPDVAADQLSWLIYTSGSTGRPKAVAITHGSAGAMLEWARSHYESRDLQGVLAGTSVCFDLSIFEIFLPLANGGTVYLVENVLALGELAEKDDITLINTVPSAGAELLRRKAIPPSVRVINLAGEPLSSRLADALYGQTRVEKVYDLYGPSEDTTYSTWALRMPGGPAVIGHPILQTRAYPLDDRLQLEPVNVPGELALGGAGLARGYFGKPGQTAERFVPDPFSSIPGERLYLSGDLARLGEDGNLRISGRIDHQVKIQGYRIEPGEIANTLERHHQVTKAVVLPREAPSGKRLVAFVTTGDQAPETATLQDWLGRFLPAYSIPSAFVVIDAIPLTPNGKVDRIRLLDMAEHKPQKAHTPPRTPEEVTLAGIWARILELDQTPGLEHHFFESGGHSLTATRLIARIRSTFGIDLTLRDLFAAPTLGQLADVIRQGTAGDLIEAPAKVSPRPESLPLSFAQQRLWILDQLDRNSATYNMPGAFRIIGKLHRKALERSFEQIIQRHESLRTLFSAIEENGEQIITETAPFDLPCIDLGALPRAGAEREAERLAGLDILRPFDLRHGPLFRAMLIRLSQGDYMLLINMHHIISDGWSIGIIIRELAAFYNGNCTASQAALPDLPLQYADYAIWQHRWLRGAAMERQLEYWTEALAGAPPALEMPTSQPRPAYMTHRGARVSLVLSVEHQAGLERLALQTGATLFVVMEAILAELLGRYAGADEVCIGTPVANRRYAELEPLIGFFVNTLVLRNTRDPRQTVSERITSLRDAATNAFAHQDLPFERLVEALNPVRDASRSPLFQAMFTMQNTPISGVDLHQLTVTPWQQERLVSKFDLDLEMVQTGDGLQGNLIYNRDLFDHQSMTRLMDHYRRLLRGAVDYPNRKISTLTILSSKEKKRILYEINNTDTSIPHEQSYITLFEEQTVRAPERTAVTFHDLSYSYGEMNAKANGVGKILAARGLRPDQTAAIFAPRSHVFLMSILSVYKCGAAYLPMDLKHPSERLARVLELGRPTMVLISRDLESIMQEAFGVSEHKPELIILEDLLEEATPEPINPPHRSSPQNLAYTIFTSGSTGVPKGAMVVGLGLVNHLYGLIDYMELTEDDVIAQNSPQCFDISVWQFLAALLVGARTHIYDDETVRDPKVLATHTGQNRVSILEIVPSMLREILEQMEYDEALQRQFDQLRWLLLTGEALPPELPGRWLRFHPDVPIINAYGPSECSDDVSFYTIGEDLPAETINTPIGSALINIRLYVLDSNMSPVPDGVNGELYVGGISVGRGYLQDPLRTAGVFIPDPFSSEPGSRLYKTGDLARYLDQGVLEFLGRIDHQVKLRGFRIELGEIESILSQHPDTGLAAVVIRNDTQDNQQLVAYVTCSGDLEKSRVEVLPAHLKAWCGEKMPEYMTPVVITILDGMPLNANGKIDRKALPDPDFSHSRKAYRAPVGHVETVLTQIWEEVLGMQKIGCNDNFFELGGHSLMATRVMARITKNLGIDLPVRVLFQAPTIETLALQLEESANQPALPAPRPVPRTASMPLSFAQQRLWFLYYLEGPSATYNMPGAMELNGPLEPVVLQRAFATMIDRHETLRTRFTNEDNVPGQVIDPFMGFRLPICDLSGLDPQTARDEAARLTTAHAVRPFDLEQGPLLRICLLKLAETRHILLLNMHHIISDGSSTELFIGEMMQLYLNPVKPGEADHLEPLAIQYADYAAWQKENLAGETLQNMIDYWRNQLAGAPAGLELPTIGPRPAMQTANGRTINFAIPDDLTRDLNTLALEQRVTLFQLLEAAFAELLGRYSGSKDINIGSPVANRRYLELEPLIGFFANTLVLRNILDPEDNLGQRLARVSETTLNADANQDMPFEKLVEVINPVRDTSRSPLFQVFFAFQKIEEQLSIPGPLQITPISPQNTTARFDMALDMEDVAGKLSGNLEYNTDLYDAQLINNIIRHYTNLLRAFTRAAGPVSQLPIQTLEERETLLASWNETMIVEHENRCFHQLFQDNAARMPDRIAVSDHERSYTYAQLNQRANALAHYLRRKGIANEAPVGVFAPRDADFLAAILGIFKAGGSYMPMDINHPENRLSQVLEKSEASVVLSNADDTLLRRAADNMNNGAEVVSFQHAFSASDNQENPPVHAQPANRAYIIFTSGSTGKPKGAMITHHGMLNHIESKIRDCSLTKDEFIAQNAPQSFDVSVWQFLTALLIGARTVVYNDETARDPGRLLNHTRDQQVTVMEVVPSMLRAMVEHVSVNSIETGRLRLLVLVGEALPPELAARWLEIYPQTPLVNAFGPTECSDNVSHYIVNTPPEPEMMQMPIGKAIINTRLYVVDAYGQPVPDRIQGELWAGGPGVCRGYIGDPARTAAVFVPDPFGTRPGERLYRLGDLVRYNRDHKLVYLGRMDHQVKVRGFRIELGEIEAVLAQHPATAHNVALVRPNARNEMQVVAYVTLSEAYTAEDQNLTNDLKDWCRDKMPDYMTPTVIAVLPEIPLNANGKVDRKVLLEQAITELETTAADFEAPREDEQEMATLWAGILNIDEKLIGRRSRFFDLGGHSLLATQVIGQVNRQFQVEMPLRVLFEHPTLAEFNERLQELRVQDVDMDRLKDILDEVDGLSEDELSLLLE